MALGSRRPRRRSAAARARPRAPRPGGASGRRRASPTWAATCRPRTGSDAAHRPRPASTASARSPSSSIGGTDDVLALDGPERVCTPSSTDVTDVVDRATERWGTQFLSSDNAANAVGLMLTAGVPTSVGERRGAPAAHGASRSSTTARTSTCASASTADGSTPASSARPIRRGFTAIGDAVNLSARLDAAGAFSPDRRRPRRPGLLGDPLRGAPLAPFRVKNRVSLVEAAVVGAVVERASARRRP